MFCLCLLFTVLTLKKGKKLMKKIAAIVLTVILFTFTSISYVSASTDAETMETINNAPIGETVDINNDGKSNIIDLIQSKANREDGQINLSTDYLLGKSISKSTYDADILSIERLLFEFWKLIDSNDIVVSCDKVNEQNVLVFYNRTEQNLKKIKLANQFVAEDQYSQICDLDIPSAEEPVTATIAVNADGKLGWTPDSFIASRNRTFDLDVMAPGEANITFLKSVLSKRFRGRNVTVSGGVAEFVVYNDNRKIVLTSAKYSNNSETGRWFYKYTDYEVEVTFSYDDSYKVIMSIEEK